MSIVSGLKINKKKTIGLKWFKYLIIYHKNIYLGINNNIYSHIGTVYTTLTYNDMLTV